MKGIVLNKLSGPKEGFHVVGPLFGHVFCYQIRLCSRSDQGTAWTRRLHDPGSKADHAPIMASLLRSNPCSQSPELAEGFT